MDTMQFLRIIILFHNDGCNCLNLFEKPKENTIKICMIKPFLYGLLFQACYLIIPVIFYSPEMWAVFIENFGWVNESCCCIKKRIPCIQNAQIC